METEPVSSKTVTVPSAAEKETEGMGSESSIFSVYAAFSDVRLAFASPEI